MAAIPWRSCSVNLTQLYELRRKGKKPAGLVVLTLLPELSKHLECVDVTRDQEVRALVHLDLLLAFHSSQASSAIDLTIRIVSMVPQQLELWELDTGKWESVISDYEAFIHPIPPKLGLFDLSDNFRYAANRRLH